MHRDDFFLGRQPIIGRKGDLVAYELLFRSSSFNAAIVLDNVAASAAVIQHSFADLGLHAALGNKLGFINVPEDLLMSDAIKMLPPRQVVLEILETVPITPPVIDRCQHLKAAGFTLALDDIIDLTEAHIAVLPHIEVVKIDVLALPQPQIIELVRRLHHYGVTLLAEKVETVAQYSFCRELGFELFQGYFFARPTILTGRAMPPAMLATLKLFSLVAADAELDEIDMALKQAPDLTLRLLKMANSAAFNPMNKIYSVRNAIIVLGRVQLRRLLQIMVLAQHSGGDAAKNPVVQTAVMRGRLMEETARALGWKASAERAFMVGMLSLADALLGQPLAEIVRHLDLDDSVRDALFKHEGQLGTLLQLVETAEQGDGLAALAILAKLDFPGGDAFNRLQIEALDWASHL